MKFNNKATQTIGRLNALPQPLRGFALTKAIGSVVKYMGTSSVKVHELNYQRGEFSLDNIKKIQNHIGSVHAAAIALLAESASGLVVNMNVPDTNVPVIKTLKVNYEKRTQGALKAVATLTETQIQEIRTTEKGEVTVEVHVTDESGREPVVCEMIWAWTPKRRN
ncbi:MAG: DUF4442 domain-containing protein [SAR324 cluster bacterium]|nr:DUF4442 domain-containing protein [SAR324 cluster bacterium]